MNILWDVDGTLFDTYPAYAHIVKNVMGGTATEERILAQLKISSSHAARHFGLSETQERTII